MKKLLTLFVVLYCLMQLSCTGDIQSKQTDEMDWWRDARFGLFIHWGLYAIPAGEWNGETNHAEWIRQTAEIPLETYDKFVDQFNPTKFDAQAWVQMAKAAGMKYIVITSKHHDGFCLFDSKHTDYDVMSTPFQRDILKELSDACHEAELEMCWYHSIMDWHHPDYLPRRPWETNRSTEGADYDRYVTYMKNQLAELTSNYGKIGVLWFDGEWEDTWNHERGVDLYNYVKSLQPGIIVNNRVDKGRAGMQGMTQGDEYKGDFGTPEQEIPATGLPNVDWETCMTMNDHWGYNKNDDHWKSTTDLLQKLADIASKGGNFLLNVGPKADGTFPQESIDRLAAIGDWMKINNESIYGTSASPFKQLDWGRCTQKAIKGGTRLYLHVFEWPADGKLVLNLMNDGEQAFCLAAPDEKLATTREGQDIIIELPETAYDAINTVVALDIIGTPDIVQAPVIEAAADQFVHHLKVNITAENKKSEIHYTLDGSDPTTDSPTAKEPIVLEQTTTVKTSSFRDGEPASETVTAKFTKVPAAPALQIAVSEPGIAFSYFTGSWDTMPDFDKVQAVKSGVVTEFDLSTADASDFFALQFTGYIQIPQDAVYTFYTISDDGSQLFIDDKLVVDSDGVHSAIEKSGSVALAAGTHKIRVCYFERDGGNDFEVAIAGPELEKQAIPAEMLFVK